MSEQLTIPQIIVLVLVLGMAAVIIFRLIVDQILYHRWNAWQERETDRINPDRKKRTG